MPSLWFGAIFRPLCGFKARVYPFMTAAWNVRSVTGDGVLLEMALLIVTTLSGGVGGETRKVIVMEVLRML